VAVAKVTAVAPVADCAACWGGEAASPGQAINTVINHIFNTAFDWLSTLPGGPVADVLSGALVLIRRSLFLSPLGVTATQAGTELTVTVNTGSVAYVRQNGGYIEVSGLPSFVNAQRFTASTVSDLSAGNPGNAGCAGFVLTSGTVDAALQTSQIDRLRFDTGASFTHRVTATVSGGPLTLQDAVRSDTGVEFHAAVVLDNDVEVDGGKGDVIFASTVDATNAGKQSLTVTALGTTTFAGAVGGQAALASLLTRGVVPLDIEQGSDSKTVPLHFLPDVDEKGKVQAKYGIDVAIGNNASQLYEFDTGGNSFFAGYNPTFWKNVGLSTDAVTVSYTSGNTFNSVLADAIVTIGQGAQKVSTAQPIQIGAILTGSNTKKENESFVFDNPDAPPVDGNFFGDFGASFDVLQVQNDSELLASPLLQLPGNLSSGFLVQLGPIGTNPQLTVGITDALRAQFPYAVPVAEAPGDATYPVSGYPVLQLFGIAPQYFAQQGDDPRVAIGTESSCTGAQCLPTVIDSGAPSTGIRLGDSQGPYELPDGQLTPGVKLIAEFPTTQGRDPLTWTMVAGNTQSVDFVKYENASVALTTQNVNTGLNIYNVFDVIFDADKQVIWLRPNDGQATVVAGSVTTTGEQTYRQNAQLGGTYTGGRFTVGGATQLATDVVVNTGSAAATFYGTVDGSYSLAVNSTGTTTFVREVGLQTALTTLTTNAGGTTASGGITTQGDQNFGDEVALSGHYDLLAGSFSVGGDATLAGPVNLVTNASGAGIVFDGRIEGAPGRGFTLNLSTLDGSVTLNGDVGATNPLGGIAVDELPGSGSPTMTFTANGSIMLDGGLGFTAEKGLVLGGSGAVTAQLANGGVVRGFTDSGILVGAGSGGVISGFVISNNGVDGIQANGAAGLTLADNAIMGNAAAGIQTQGGSGLAITRNTLSGNGSDGIKIIEKSDSPINDVTISSNFISRNVSDGIELKGDSTGHGESPLTISGNTITNNQEDGILSDGLNDVTISNNTVTGNTKNGVTVDGSVGNAVLANSIFANTGKGIALENGGNADQPEPTRVNANLAAGTITIAGKVEGYTGYDGPYLIQVFLSPSSASSNVQGQQFLGEQQNVAQGDFEFAIAGDAAMVGGFITLTATPMTGPQNTSKFSEAAQVLG
jgi:parallel beta-helix repeat protein